MNSILYAANIGTLAAWLSVSGASTVGIFVERPETLPELKVWERHEIRVIEGEILDVEMLSGGSAAARELDAVENEEVLPEQEAATAEIPDMPETAENLPLPELPDFPQPKPEPKPSPVAPTTPKPAVAKASIRKAETTKRGTDRPVARGAETGAGTGSGSSGRAGAGSGETGAARFAGGRMPKPSYPANARRQGIEGTVRASITVDESGRVVSASIVSASHPALNDRAILGTLSRWKFKPGARATRILPINFTLN